MHIIEVIPLTHLPISQPQILSYFFSQSLPQGTLVKIPLKMRNAFGITLHSYPLKQKKAEIKKSAFSLKPISQIISPKPIIPFYFFSLANFLSHYYFTPLSLTFKTILPPRISIWAKHIYASSKIDLKPSSSQTIIPEVITDWSILENSFHKFLAQNKQILLLVPTTFHQQFFYNLLQKKFNDYIYEFHRDISSQEFARLWNNLLLDKPFLIIGLRSAIFLPWTNLKQIVIVNPNHSAYKSWEQKPYYEATVVAFKLSQLFHASLSYYQDY